MPSIQKISAESNLHRDILIRDAILGMIRRYPQDGVFLLPTLDMLALRFQEPLMLSLWSNGKTGYHCFLSNVENELLIKSAEKEYLPHQPPTCKPIQFEHPEVHGETILLPCGPDPRQTIALTVQSQIGRGAATLQARQLGRLFKNDRFWKEFRAQLAKGIVHAPLRWTQTFDTHCKVRLKALTRAAEIVPSFPGGLEKDDVIFHDFDASAEFTKELLAAIDAFLWAKREFHHLHHPGPSETSSLPNLHFCVASALPSVALRRNCFTYTAKLLFTQHQREALRDYLTDPKAEPLFRACVESLRRDVRIKDSPAIEKVLELIRSHNDVKLLEYLTAELKEQSSASADTSFTSGSVSFGGSPGRSIDRAKSESDILRRVAESFFYGLCRPEDGGENIFHVPLHVNGVAWIDIFSFTKKRPAQDDESWQHNYLLYRDIITDLGAIIRQAAETSFFQVLDNLLHIAWSSPIGDPKTVVDALNSQLFRLSLTAPFPWLIFTQKPAETHGLRLPHRRLKEVFLEVTDNPFFLQTVNFRPVVSAQVAERVERSVKRANDSCTLEENRHVAYQAHMLKVPLRALHSSVATIPNDTHRLRLCEVVDWMIAMEDWLSPSFDRSKTLAGSKELQIISCGQWISNLKEFLSTLRSQFAALHDSHPPIVENDALLQVDDNQALWSFYGNQWRAVLQTLWNNACTYGRRNTAFRLQLTASSWRSRRVLLLSMKNEVAIPERELDIRINLTRTANINQLGIATLNLLAKRLLGDHDYEVLHHKEVSADGALFWIVTVPIAIQHEIPP